MAAPTTAQSNHRRQPEAPFRFAAAVTPNDGADLARPSDGIYIAVAGTLTVLMDGDNASILFTALPVGFHRIAARRVMATGTAATGIVALYF